MNGADFPKTTERMWQEAAKKLLKGRSFKETLFSHTDEGITLKPIYFEGISPAPYIRVSEERCLIAQTLFCSNRKFNMLAGEVMQQGQTALNVNLDISSQLGVKYKKTGYSVHLRSYTNFKKLFNGIDLTQTALFFNALYTAPDLFKWLQKWCSENKKDPAALQIALGSDPLSATLLFGGGPVSLQESLTNMVPAFKSREDYPAVDLLTIHADIVHNSGGNMLHQLVYAMAVANIYIKGLASLGIDPQVSFDSLRVKMAVGNEQFMEIAKLRALRLLLFNMALAWGVRDNRFKVDVVTSWRWLSRMDVHSNMLRSAGQAFSAVVGGCDSLDVLPFDLALKIPDEFSLRQARNLPVILNEEAHLNHVSDPAAGSYYLDELSVQLAEKSWLAFSKLEKQGGLEKAVRSGKWQAQVKENAVLQQQRIDEGRQKAIGLNCYRVEQKKMKSKEKDYYYNQVILFQDIKPLTMSRILPPPHKNEG